MVQAIDLVDLMHEAVPLLAAIVGAQSLLALIGVLHVGLILVAQRVHLVV